MVDRIARDKLLAAIDRFLKGETGSFTFDDEVFAIESQDQTVRDIALDCWFCYDDCIDHPVKLTRDGWNHMQRLRLMLASNAQFQKIRRWQWSPAHSYAAGALLVLAMVFWSQGWGFLFLMANFAAGLGFWYFASRDHAKRPATEAAIYQITPFQSLSILRDVRESVPDFKKLRYPAQMNLTPRDRAG